MSLDMYTFAGGDLPVIRHLVVVIFCFLFFVGMRNECNRRVVFVCGFA